MSVYGNPDPNCGFIEIFQNEPDGSIYVDVVDNLDTFDVETADGFEPEEEELGPDTAELLH